MAKDTTSVAGNLHRDEEAQRLLECAADYVLRGWTQCRDAVDGSGVGVPVWSKRAECWCALGAIRAANIRIGLVTLYAYPRDLTPFASSVYWRALQAVLRQVYPHRKLSENDLMLPAWLTSWNDTEAMSGETVALKLREGAALIRKQIKEAKRGD